MPLNVVDQDGKHIGFIQRSYPDKDRVLMIALSDMKVEEIELDMNQIRNFLAGWFESRNFIGKIDEYKLEKKLSQHLMEKYPHLKGIQYDEFMKYLYVKIARDRFELPVEKSKVKGYLLFDAKQFRFEKNHVVLEQKIDYIDDAKLDNGIPIYAKIVDYPELHTDIMGTGEGLLFGDLSDLGGRNHSHFTKLKIESGNFRNVVEFPIFLFAQKGMNIQFYMEEKKVNKILCNEMVYRF